MSVPEDTPRAAAPAPELLTVLLAHLQMPNKRLKRMVRRQCDALLASFERYGVIAPIIVDKELRIIDGVARVAAARQAGHTQIPAIRIDIGANDARGLRLALNRIGEMSQWVRDQTALEVKELTASLGFSAQSLGFDQAEADRLIAEAVRADLNGHDRDPDALPRTEVSCVTRPGDVWALTQHLLVCGSALERKSYASLLRLGVAQCVLTDPPYNVPVPGHVSGKGRVRHGNFVMGSGEMSRDAYRDFLRSAAELAGEYCRDGAVGFAFIDWRGVRECVDAFETGFGAYINLAVWVKTNGGMGSLYRSQHEFACVFAKGGAPACNNVKLGRSGRTRTNVWTYPGLNAFSKDRRALLAMHPTVKPVAMLEDAILDVTERADLVLDPFAGSGSTLIAAHRCGRIARLIELDPRYCDVIVRRFEAYTGQEARLVETNETFDEVAARRAQDPPPPEEPTMTVQPKP